MLGDIDSQIQRNISDPSAAAKYRKISDQDAAGIDEQIKAYESTFLVDAEKRGLAAYHPRWDAYRKAYTEVLEAAARGDIEAAKTAYLADAAPLYGEVDSDLAGLARVNRTEAKALDSRIGDKYRSSRVNTLVASLVAFAVGGGIAFLVARGIKSGVSQLLARFRKESQDAAGQIAELIGEIQGQTRQVVEVVAEGTRRTEEGVATVDQTRQAFEHIGEVVDEMSGRVGEIVAAVQQIAGEAARAETDIAEVASVAEQSSASAEEVSASTQQTSASAEEIAASAQSLASTAEQLDDLVKRFKVTA